MNDASIEAAVLDNVAENLKAEGFSVYVQPSGPILPPFMAGYRPDALAFRGDKRLAIEVVSDNAASRQRLDEIRAKLAGQNDWELMVIWANPEEARILQSSTKRSIEEAIAAAEMLVSHNQITPALLLAWAAFEASARASSPKTFSRPQSTARLIEVLANEGQITPSEADLLREISRKRNLLAHGDFQTSVSSEEVQELLQVTKTAFREVA